MCKEATLFIRGLMAEQFFEWKERFMDEVVMTHKAAILQQR